MFEILEDFIDDPLGTTIDVATQPVRDTLEVLGGLTEGEIRLEAITRLGVDVAIGMGTAELIEWYNSEN